MQAKLKLSSTTLNLKNTVGVIEVQREIEDNLFLSSRGYLVLYVRQYSIRLALAIIGDLGYRRIKMLIGATLEKFCSLDGSPNRGTGTAEPHPVSLENHTE